MKPHLLQRLALTCYLLLFALLIAWLTVLSPPAPGLVAFSLLLLPGPLLLALRGVLYGRRYTMAWSTLLILFYFAHGVAAMANPGPERWLGAAEVLLSLGYFATAVGYIRATRRPR